MTDWDKVFTEINKYWANINHDTIVLSEKLNIASKQYVVEGGKIENFLSYLNQFPFKRPEIEVDELMKIDTSKEDTSRFFDSDNEIDCEVLFNYLEQEVEDDWYDSVSVKYYLDSDLFKSAVWIRLVTEYISKGGTEKAFIEKYNEYIDELHKQLPPGHFIGNRFPMHNINEPIPEEVMPKQKRFTGKMAVEYYDKIDEENGRHPTKKEWLDRTYHGLFKREVLYSTRTRAIRERNKSRY